MVVAGLIVDEILARDLRKLFGTTILFILLPVLQAWLIWLRDRASTLGGEIHGINLRERLFAHVLRLPINYYFRARIDEGVTCLTENVRQAAQGYRVVSDEVRYISGIILALMVLSVIYWPLALMLIVLLALRLTSGLLFAGLAKTSSSRYLAAASDVANYLRENLRLVAFTRVSGSSEWEIRRFQSLLREKSDQVQGSEAKDRLMFGLRDALITGVEVVFVYGLALFFFSRHSVSLGTMMITISFMLYGSWAAAGAVTCIKNHVLARAAAGRIEALLAVPEETWPGTVEPPHEVDSIEWRNVSFQYEYGKPVLQNFSLRIQRNEIVLLFGESGTGKSTAVDIMSGLLLPSSGNIVINGHIDLTEIAVERWRQRLSITSQYESFFSGTTYENIVYGKETVPLEEVASMARRLGLDPSRLSETRCGDVSSYIVDSYSGGERQRIALLRALTKAQPPLAVVLDEPTAFLDNATEKRVLQIIVELRHSCPVLIVTHRHSMKKYADRVVYMSKSSNSPQPVFARAAATCE